MRVTLYAIERDYDNETRFFRVNCGYYKGFGFQVKAGKKVIGLSLTRLWAQK